MPISGSAPDRTYTRSDGTRTGSAVCVQERDVAGLNNTAELADARENDFATALNVMLMKDGGNKATANIPMNGFKLTGMGTGSASTDSACISQLMPATTSCLFVQTSAPTGWTKSTTHNDKALRVVSGTASSGGSVAFSTAFASQSVAGTVGNTTLDVTQIPAHSHTYTDPGHNHNIPNTAIGGAGGAGRVLTGADTSPTTGTSGIGITINNTGGGGSHTHTFTGTAINLAVNYVDVILCTKDAYV